MREQMQQYETEREGAVWELQARENVRLSAERSLA